MDTFDSKLQQKALQQPKQKKSKSAEFLMEREERDTVVGIENPAFEAGSSTELSIPPVWLGREIRGDRPDSTLAARHKKMELQAPAKERGGAYSDEIQSKTSQKRNEGAQNYFDPSSAEQTDPRHCGTAGVNAEDELELTISNADENRLYERMAALLNEDNTLIDIPGTVLASRDEEVLEVKAGDLVLQRRLLLHSGGDASGCRSSQAHSTAKTLPESCTGLGTEDGLRTGRMETSRESTVKMNSAEEVIPQYAQQLRERVRPDMIMLGSLSLQQQMAEKRPLKKSEWAKRKKELMAFFTGSVKEPNLQRDYDAAERPPPRFNTLLRCENIESPSLRALGEGQEEAVAKCGQTTELPESSSSASQSQWQGSCCASLQPLEVRVCCLRATRDKLPRGLYTVSVALHSRLGGPALAWRDEKEQQTWAVSTEPHEHRGRFYDIDLHVNQSLFMISPAACEITPSMVLVFKLIAVPGDGSHISSVLAWGAFPVCGPSLSLIQGRFKTPLLRGEPSAHVDQFKKIEALISSDLDHWLCNLYFKVKRFPPGTSGASDRCIHVTVSSSNPPDFPQSEAQCDQLQNQLPVQHQPPSQPSPQPIHPRSQQRSHAGPSCRAGEPTVVHSHRGSPLHLSADSAGSSSSLPGKNFSSGAFSENTGEKSDACREKAEGGILHKKKPIKKTNSCGPSMSGRSAPPRQPDKHKMQPSVENLSTEEMEEYTFSLQSAQTGPVVCPVRLSHRARLALRMLPSELGLPLLGQQQLDRSWHGSIRQLGLIMLLLALMWFVRLYLHYCSQWLYLQAIAVPVNKFRFHAHTVDLVYQSSLLHTREELAMVVVGPLTLNAITFLLVLIRWGCQQIFGSLPSFTSKFIMAQGVWTVLDPLAVFAVDAVLGRLAYSPDTPVGDAAKLYWHFYRTDQSGAAGVAVTLFLYGVIFLLSATILFIYLLRFHNDGRMLDVFQRLTAREGTYFVPQDLELSNQELSFIVKKAEQWRGFSGERRKVVVDDYIWTSDEPVAGSAASGDEPRTRGAPQPEGERSTHVTVYTLSLRGLKQRFRHFLRQPDGAILEVTGGLEEAGNATSPLPCPGQTITTNQREDKAGATSLQLRKRKKLFGRPRRVEPIGGSGCGASLTLRDLNG